jgi:hypothetical protein
MDTVCDFVIRGPHTGAVFGVGISSGDVNGDGDEDLIVGAYGTFIYPVCELAGRVYIYFGGPNFDTIPDVILNGGHNNDQEAFGSTVSGSGDVNNDGFDDVIVGAMNYGYNHGRVYIYYGGNPMNTVYDVAIIGEEAGQSIGEFSVDFVKNYQTFDYAVFGTPLWGPTSPQGNNPGKVYILYGGNPMDSIPDVWMVGRTTESNLGMKAYSAGRCNNDFYDEVIAGAPVEYAGTGTSYLWLGGSNIDTIPDAWLKGTQSVIGIGWNVASAGDVDGDGKDEVIVSNYAGGPKRVWVCKYSGVGVEEVSGKMQEVRNISIYPNPVKSVLRVRCPFSVKEMKVYDVAGNTVKVIKTRSKRHDAGENEIKWDLRGENNRRVANGIYFVEITAENEQKEIKKVIITK